MHSLVEVLFCSRLVASLHCGISAAFPLSALVAERSRSILPFCPSALLPSSASRFMASQQFGIYFASGGFELLIAHCSLPIAFCLWSPKRISARRRPSRLRSPKRISARRRPFCLRSPKRFSARRRPFCPLPFLGTVFPIFDITKSPTRCPLHGVLVVSPFELNS